ncbi:transcriptional regulator [candidate division WOR-1 bacterium RIFOXYA12_FULL_52_29]|uniref:Transcriptional regulator n=1 Tax=candidate division WOR-1 bacterium RIFOXYC12_FULL_54_18 TaxID=1802584 RepID=A0A1F4T7F0_UNCSA|nr:MAG: transcriptional regulator [candidate division WOR-1 bacterium RIFOXYA2_FULL_51_19]OGC18294.1 MAG: transcriptional regulator [candidate division WOR-1 bacterium RIFOXYA12_FULL_52_29]OGC27149.1 MAG: transcriptional regulator [candidate division WOR-1 bacterium RIFOXYB2_FULL_45_9]OGC28711.1 MAG: transcriptional regulator [candidate division WOR-1 bacterium RIFOXYC12_FULL_54_18]OGC30834.1 MAG: transcriptional regulator [candidate division WOR-1 bacterium RIFOXYB12_FULL_52_16]
MIAGQTEKRAELLKALGHPARLAIVRGLLGSECNVNKMVNGLGLPQSTVSQHLNVLKAAGVIKGERRGVKVCYRVVDQFVKKVLEIK